MEGKNEKRQPVRDLLLALMAQAGIPLENYDTTTIAQLALRLDAKRGGLRVHAACPRCGAEYGLQAWLYLEPTGYFMRDGSRPAGQKPELEGRKCKRCGEEMRVDAGPGAKASTPLWQQW